MKTKNTKILLVDDESDIREFLSYNLTKEGYQVTTAKNGKEAIEKAKEFVPHLIVLDVMMPEMDGMEACEKLRELDEFNDTLIVFLTARGEDYSQIAGFDAGADDYITKPIKPKVFISKIKALLKRYSKRSENTDNQKNLIIFKDLNIDIEKHEIKKNDKVLELARKEFALLLLLISKPGRVFTREEIYNSVWGENVIVGDRTIDVHIRKLREKIGNDYIKTIKGIGYKFLE